MAKNTTIVPISSNELAIDKKTAAVLMGKTDIGIAIVDIKIPVVKK